MRQRTTDDSTQRLEFRHKNSKTNVDLRTQAKAVALATDNAHLISMIEKLEEQERLLFEVEAQIKNGPVPLSYDHFMQQGSWLERNEHAKRMNEAGVEAEMYRMLYQSASTSADRQLYADLTLEAKRRFDEEQRWLKRYIRKRRSSRIRHFFVTNPVVRLVVILGFIALLVQCSSLLF